MEIRVKKDELLTGVDIVSKAVKEKSPMPILECILFTVIDDEIRLMANDTEFSIETVIKGDIKETGMVAIDAKTLTGLVKKLPNDDVLIITDEKAAAIKCGKLKANVPVRDGSGFPAVPVVSRETAVKISQFSLREIIRQTIFCSDDKKANKMMGAELFNISGNRLNVTALDGCRIAFRSIELKDSYEDRTAVIPSKALKDLSSIIPGGVNDEVEICFTDNHVLFGFDATTVVARLVDGKYFDTAKMLNMSYSTQVKVNKRELLESIDRSTLFLSNIDKQPVVVDITGNTLEWKITSSHGSMTEDLDVSTSGNDLKIGFNPKFLMEALKAIDDEEVTLHLESAKMPAAIKDDAESYVYFILPVNFQ